VFRQHIIIVVLDFIKFIKARFLIIYKTNILVKQ